MKNRMMSTVLEGGAFPIPAPLRANTQWHRSITAIGTLQVSYYMVMCVAFYMISSKVARSLPTAEKQLIFYVSRGAPC